MLQVNFSIYITSEKRKSKPYQFDEYRDASFLRIRRSSWDNMWHSNFSKEAKDNKLASPVALSLKFISGAKL